MKKEYFEKCCNSGDNKEVHLFLKYIKHNYQEYVVIGLLFVLFNIFTSSTDWGTLNGWQAWFKACFNVLKDASFQTLWIAIPVYILSRTRVVVKEQEELHKEFATKVDLLAEQIHKDLLTSVEKQAREQKVVQEKYDAKVNDLAKRIHDDLPTLTSLITQEKGFESKLQKIQDIQVPGARWIYSKFISSLLEKSFSSFTIKMPPLEYSSFSGELFELCQKSIYLTGSMRPSEWLKSLVNTSSLGSRDANAVNRDHFFNNKLNIDQFRLIVGKKNHSITLKNNTTIGADNKFRVVCLNDYDWKHLFISERSIDAYYDINAPEDIKHSYFRILAHRDSTFNPFEYEYALYDNELLLKYHKRDFMLTLISKEGNNVNGRNNQEFDAVKDFFSSYISLIQDKTRDDLGDLKGYTYIKEQVRIKKLQLLGDIFNNKNRLPHKLSYLYSGGLKWEEYVSKDSTKYKSFATQAVEDGVRHFFGSQGGIQELEIIEIGAGTGDKTIQICDILAHRIESYTLLDISNQLLDKAQSKLYGRMPRLEEEQKSKKILLDCCLEENEERFRQAIQRKDVFILSNSTLLTETGFNWRVLRKAQKIFITIDLLVKTEKENEDLKNALEDYLVAKELLLYPLKIFEIPLEENISDKLFSSDYDNKHSVFRVKFNLKKYFDTRHIDFGELKNFTEDNLIPEILDTEEKDEEKRRKLNHAIEDKNKKIGRRNKIRQEKNVSYLNQRERFREIEDLVVLESLKFKYDKANHGKTETEITNYFKDLGFSTEVKLFEYEDGNKTEAFAAILLTPCRR